MRAVLRSILLGSLLSLSENTKSQNWDWATNAQSDGAVHGMIACTDPTNNVIVSGPITSSTVSFGGNSYQARSTYLAKCDAFSGNWLWAVTFGNPNEGVGIGGITSDSNGNIFIAGSFNGPDLTIENQTITNTGAGSADIFIAKFRPDGTLVWVRGYGGASFDGASGISTDPFDNIVVTAQSSSYNLVLGTTTISSTPNTGSQIMAKFDGSGDVIWVKNIVGGSIAAISTDPNANIFLTGKISSTLTVGNSVLNTPSGFLAKFDSDGNGIWARTTVEPKTVFTAVCNDRYGNAYVTGYRDNPYTITFPPVVLQYSYAIAGGFIAKYDLNGNVEWAKGSQANIMGLKVACDSSSVYFSCVSGNVVSFESYNVSAPNGFGSCGTLFQLDLEGNIKNGVVIDTDFGLACTSNLNNKGAYVTSNFIADSLRFDSVSLYQSGYKTLFVAKFNPQEVDSSQTTSFSNQISNQFTPPFPNPNNGSFRIKNPTTEVCELLIHNSLGQVIYTQKIQPGENEISIPHKFTGVFSCRISNSHMILFEGKLMLN